MGNTLFSLSLSLFQKPSALLLFFARNSDVVTRAIRAIYSDKALFLFGFSGASGDMDPWSSR